MILDKKDHRPPRNDYGETLTAPPDGVKAETEIPSLSFSSLYNGLDAERSNEPQRPSAAGGRGKKLPQAALNPASRPPPGGRSRARSVARFRARSTELRSAFEHDKQYITNIAQRFLFLPRSTHMVMTSDASDADRAASDASDADRAACLVIEGGDEIGVGGGEIPDVEVRRFVQQVGGATAPDTWLQWRITHSSAAG